MTGDYRHTRLLPIVAPARSHHDGLHELAMQNAGLSGPAFLVQTYAASSAGASAVSLACNASISRPAFWRILPSILAAISGLSFRKVLAFSRPWPRRWLSYENQAPDFSTTLAFTPRSISSPIFEMPSPNMMSNSTCLKGGATLFLTTFTRTWLPIGSSRSFRVDVRRMSRRTEA